MPLKVRCPGCEKVLNVPDAARGKAVRCPKCEKTVKIPAGKPAQKRSQRKRPVPQTAPESADDLLNLNLREAEDYSERICPACGAPASDEDTICHACGVDLVTGSITEKERTRRGRKGPDPSTFYGFVWSDGWDFMKSHKSLAFRTFGYWLGFSALLAPLLWLVDYTETLPPKVFAVAFSVIVAAVFPGWLWNLNMRIMLPTGANKKDLGRINFDIFMNVAAGFKLVIWSVIFFAPAAVFAAPFALLHPLAFLGAFAVSGFIVMTAVPVALGHMGMLVTWKAWLSPILLPIAFRNFGHSVWWILMLFTVLLVSAIPMGIAGGVYHAEIAKLVEGVEFVNKSLFFMVMIAAATVSHLIFSFLILMSMRCTGQYLRYNKSSMELITKIEEKKYVPKRLDEIESVPEGLTFKKVALGLVFALVMGMVFGSISATLSSDDYSYLYNVGTGIWLAGSLVFLTGWMMMMTAAYHDSIVWFLIVFLFPLIGGFAYLATNFNEAKWPMFIQCSSVFFYMLAIMLAIVGG